MLVFDAGALIAYLRAEAGGDRVRDFLNDADVPCLAHAVNVCELFYDFLRSNDEATAQAAVNTVLGAGVQVREELDRALWEDVGRLKTTHHLSLADCFGLALARRFDADFVTSDHHEMDAVAQAGACRILFIR